MFTYQDRDHPKMPQPSKMHLPVLAESVLDEMSDDNHDPKHDKADAALLKLPAASLKGTFAKAYGILTEITSQIGWDMLLKYRSSVFVMEEEYRFEKSASVTAVRGGSTSKSGDSDSEDEEQSDDKPAINGHNKEAGVKENGEKGKEDGDQEEHADVIEKPEHSVLPEEVKGGTETGHPNSEGKISTQKYSHIQNKRLCERWLDNLFMVLYEVLSDHITVSTGLTPNQDLRVYTIWRSDLARYGQQKRPYRKSATELEILGELAQRLHHHAEAEEAFQSRLQIRFSARALRGVLQTQEKSKDNRGALNSIIRLTAWQYRWYSEVRIHTYLKLGQITDSVVLARDPVLHTKIDCRRRGS